ncbi:putative glycoprotein 2-beta-D-xylosyltransferase [Helianthus annuus]|nr:putative glycoprotein 2-beta-D-xylosyltransferase [Helianthus annuus]KAJ0625641.1 putative glycoprotein 2-beta-D-xylosyltransferase [Helianthus annuus]
MHPEKIKMSMGGEVLESVIGRSEDEELSEFEGAFDLVGQKKRDGERVVSEGFFNEFIVRGGVEKHTMRELIGSLRRMSLITLREGAMKMKTFWVLVIWVLLICYLHLGFVVYLGFGIYEDLHMHKRIYNNSK